MNASLAHIETGLLTTGNVSRRVLALAVFLWSGPSEQAGAAHSAAPSKYDLAYASYLGGNESEQAREVVVLADGSLLVGAQTSSTNMPVTTGVVQPAYAGDDPGLGHPGVYGGDCYIVHLRADGQRILAATYFGGSKQERNVYGMELDSQGNIVIATATRSTDAPTTPGCFQGQYGGGPSDMLVAKLSPDLRQLLWCSYVGGAGDDFPRGGLGLDAAGNVCVVGTSTSGNFPTTPGVVQPALKGPRDSAVVKLSADGSRLVFGTFLGGTGEDDAIMGVRFDAVGNLYVAGHTRSTDFPVTHGAAQMRPGGGSDCYLAKLSPDAARLLYATYLGGAGDEFAEHRPWLEPDGTLLLAGFCGSTDFPTTAGALQRARHGPGDGFLTRLSADGTRWVFSTLLGGRGGENWLMPTVDMQGHIIVVGNTSSADFPVTADALQRTYGGGANDAAVAIVSADGSRLIYATYLGGNDDEMIRSVALGSKGEIYLVGSTSSTNFPVTTNAVQTRYGGKGDAFIVKLVPRTAE